MKPLIKLLGLIVKLSKNEAALHAKSVSLYLIVCNRFSKSDQKDFLRISTIKSLKVSFLEVTSFIKEPQQLFDLAVIMIRLLQDEIPEVRGKMANFIAKVLPRRSKTTKSLKYNPNYTLIHLFDYIEDKYLHLSAEAGLTQPVKMIRRLLEFFCEYIFESEYDIYKEKAHFEKKIFLVDKPNKFYSCVILKGIAFERLHAHLVGGQRELIHDVIREIIFEKYSSCLKRCQEHLEKYVTDPFTRDEVTTLHLFDNYLTYLFLILSILTKLC